MGSICVERGVLVVVCQDFEVEGVSGCLCENCQCCVVRCGNAGITMLRKQLEFPPSWTVGLQLGRQAIRTLLAPVADIEICGIVDELGAGCTQDLYDSWKKTCLTCMGLFAFLHV